LDIHTEILGVLDETLSLQGRAKKFTPETPLLGAVPELDSLAVAGLLTALEDRFGVVIEDDEIDGAVFATVGSLAEFVKNKIGG
jgi:acyl carrier protein